MKVIFNNIIPFKGFMSVNICGLIFCRKKWESEQHTYTFQRMLNHEGIHTAQMKELLYVFFYIIYLLEWIYRLIFHTSTAYKGLSFEREAYEHQDDFSYLESRKHYAQWR